MASALLQPRSIDAGIDPIRYPNETYGFGRVRRCTRDDCCTILCRYNPGPECYIHGRETRDYWRRVEQIKTLRATGQNPLVLL